MELDESVSTSYLDTVRTLHQTIVSLRAALKQSRNEVLELKEKSWPLESFENALKALSIENHVLRRKIVDETADKKVRAIGDVTRNNCEEAKERTTEREKNDKQLKTEQLPVKKQVRIVSPSNGGRFVETEIKIKVESQCSRKISRSFESLTLLNDKNLSPSKLSVSKTFSYSNVMERTGKTNSQTEENPQNDLDQDQEVDDIELIFTTDDTKESDFKEELVSIETRDTSDKLLQCPLTDPEHSLEISDRELEDDVFNTQDDLEGYDLKREESQLCNSRSDTSSNHEEKSLKSYYSYQDSSFENKSLEKDESFDRFEERVRIVETDISKIGIIDVEYSSGRRNTCPNPLQYRPMHHREALGKGLNVRKTRPVLAHSNAVRRESGAQTDISAIPGSSSRSESSLANKVKIGEHFTTLPSKYPLPGSRLRLSEKTVEARRVLLSDIGFTSMVPELSRSADHLCPANIRPQSVTNYGKFLKTPDLYSPSFTSQRFIWAATAASPSESQSRYSSIYPLSPPVQSRRCSAPVSPSRRAQLRSAPSRVRFANGSLPELRGDWTATVDSGDSTDSLVEEAETYLRRSIDCLTGRETGYYSETRKTVPRRASAPEPARDNVPPQGWQPFLPRIPRDLRLEHWVKVISPEGRVRGGRVRYVGPLAAQMEQFVGVQLSTPDGHSDGTYGTRRYFQCEPYHGLFVPFKKIVMGWRP